MLDNKFTKALEVIAGRLKGQNIKWAVIGSCNLALQGMAVEPRDLDIVVKLNDLKRMAEVFSEYLVKDVAELQTKSGEPVWEVKFGIESTDVQVLGELNSGQYVSKLIADKVTEVRVGNITIPCFTLEAEAQAYAETSRPAKTELIKEFLSQKKLSPG